MDEALELVHWKKASSVVAATYRLQEANEVDRLMHREEVWESVVALPSV